MVRKRQHKNMERDQINRLIFFLYKTRLKNLRHLQALVTINSHSFIHIIRTKSGTILYLDKCVPRSKFASIKWMQGRRGYWYKNCIVCVGLSYCACQFFTYKCPLFGLEAWLEKGCCWFICRRWCSCISCRKQAQDGECHVFASCGSSLKYWYFFLTLTKKILVVGLWKCTNTQLPVNTQ